MLPQGFCFPAPNVCVPSAGPSLACCSLSGCCSVLAARDAIASQNQGQMPGLTKLRERVGLWGLAG